MLQPIDPDTPGSEDIVQAIGEMQEGVGYAKLTFVRDDTGDWWCESQIPIDGHGGQARLRYWRVDSEPYNDPTIVEANLHDVLENVCDEVELPS